MDISNLLSTGGNFLTKLTESPVAAPLALATVAMFMKQKYPRFASGLAGQAVQEMFRPRDQKQRAQELLLTRPDLTSSAPPAGYTGSIVPYGGINLRRLGTLGQEFPGDYGPGVKGTQMRPSKAVLDVPYTAAAPPPVSAAISKYSPSEQSWRGLLGGLPATPEGQVAATKYGIEAGLRAQDDQRAAETRRSLMDLLQGNPDLGFEAGVGKGGSPTFKVRTQQPIAANRYDMMKEELTPAERRAVLMESGTGAAKSTRFPAPGGGPMMVKDDPGDLPAGYMKTRSANGWLITPPVKDTGPDSFTKTDYQMVARQIVEVQSEIAKKIKWEATPEELAPLQERLQVLQSELQAIKQTTQDFSTGGAGGGNKAAAVRDFIKGTTQKKR